MIEGRKGEALQDVVVSEGGLEVMMLKIDEPGGNTKWAQTRTGDQHCAVCIRPNNQTAANWSVITVSVCLWPFCYRNDSIYTYNWINRVGWKCSGESRSHDPGIA